METFGLCYKTINGALTFKSGRSFMRKRFLLKLSLRTLDQLKEFILVCPFRSQA